MEIKGITEAILFAKLKIELCKPKNLKKEFTKKEFEEILGYNRKSKPNLANILIEKLIEEGILYPSGSRKIKNNTTVTTYIIDKDVIKKLRIAFYSETLSQIFYFAFRQDVSRISKRINPLSDAEVYTQEKLKNMEKGKFEKDGGIDI